MILVRVKESQMAKALADAVVLHGKDNTSSLLKNVTTAIALHLVPAEEVSSASEKLLNCKLVPLSQIMKLHHIMTDTTNTVHHRVLSCGCSKPSMCMRYSKCVTHLEKCY